MTRHRIDQNNPQLPYVDVVHTTRTEAVTDTPAPVPKTYEEELQQAALENHDRRYWHLPAMQAVCGTGCVSDHPRTNQIFNLLSFFYDGEGYCAPLQSVLAELTGLSLRSVQRSLDELVFEKELLEKVDVGQSWDKKRNVYRSKLYRDGVWTADPGAYQRSALALLEQARTEIARMDARIESLEEQLRDAGLLEVTTSPGEEEDTSHRVIKNSSSPDIRHGDSVTVTHTPLGGRTPESDAEARYAVETVEPVEDTQFAADCAWVDQNWHRTGWRNPEAAKAAARKDPAKFARERRSYEAGWRGAGRNTLAVREQPAGRLACRKCGKVVAKQLLRGGTCFDCKPGQTPRGEPGLGGEEYGAQG